MAENSDEICEKLVKELVKKILELTQTEELTSEQPLSQESDRTERTETTERTDEMREQVIKRVDRLNSVILSRFISIIGNIALYVLIHIDLNIFNGIEN